MQKTNNELDVIWNIQVDQPKVIDTNQVLLIEPTVTDPESESLLLKKETDITDLINNSDNVSEDLSDMYASLHNVFDGDSYHSGDARILESAKFKLNSVISKITSILENNNKELVKENKLLKETLDKLHKNVSDNPTGVIKRIKQHPVQISYLAFKSTLGSNPGLAKLDEVMKETLGYDILALKPPLGYDILALKPPPSPLTKNEVDDLTSELEYIV